MATANWSGMISREDGIDLLDSVLAPLFVLASVTISQVGSLDFSEPFNAGLDYVLYSAHGTELTVAFVLALGTLLIAWISNQREWGEFDDLETAAVGLALALTVLQALVPAVNEAVGAVWYVGWFMVFVNGAAFYVLAYK